MNLGDPDNLRDCKSESLERLARALGVPLPKPGPRYELRLRRAVANGIQTDNMRAMAEERRAMTEAEQKRTAMEIAAALGENGVRQIAQIGRIVALMGAEWTREQLLNAGQWRDCPDSSGVCVTHSGHHRTFGGVFFEVCRRAATIRVMAGDLTRRQFFRCFTDRPAKPRPVVERPVPKGKERVKQLTAGPNYFRRVHDKRNKAPVPVEVYVSPKRRSA